jgi:diacylglycerol kinase (ATP)
MDNKGFTFRKRLAGFNYAFRGIRLLLRREHNAWLHSLAVVCAVTAGFLLKISVMEWIAVVIACGCVFAAEALNTAIEKLADAVSPEYNEAIRHVKDLSAGGVLLMAVAAAIAGVLIFLPKLTALWELHF